MKKVHSKDGTAIAFDQLGQGPAIILVGGAFTDRSQPTLVQLAALLAPHFTVFNYDRRGRGDSSDTAPYAVEREVEDLEALIVEAGGSAFVCGFSSGAALALAAAARGLAITKLALYEPPFIVDDSRPPLPRDFATQLTELVSSGRRGDAAEALHDEGGGGSCRSRRPDATRTILAWGGGCGAHAHLRHHHHGKQQRVADRPNRLRHGTDARDRRWGESRVDAQRGASGRGHPPRCAAPHS